MSSETPPPDDSTGLEAEEAPSPGLSSPELVETGAPEPGLPTVQLRTYGPAYGEATARILVAVLLLLNLALTLLLPWVALAADWVETVDEVEKLLSILLAPIVGLVGSAVGYYFGVRQGGSGTE
jgi:hypothetical protein